MVENHADAPAAAVDDGADDHGAGAHGGADHGEAELGPIDRTAWAVGALGIFLGLVIAAAFLAAGS